MHSKNQFTKQTKLFTIIMIFALFVSACSPVVPAPVPDKVPPGETGSSKGTKSGELYYFANAEELKAYLETNQGGDDGYARLGGVANFAVAEMAVMADSAGAAPTALKASADFAEEYSGTNIQVEGVDEADIVKNDGKYIYVLAGETLVIMDAYPAEDADIVSETSVKGRPQNLFLDGDTLVVFSTVNEQTMYWPEYSIVPVPRYTQATKAFIYDVSDKSDPELLETISISGSYNQARMLGGEIYVITNEYPQFEPYLVQPRITWGDEIIMPRIAHFDNPEDNYQYTIVTKFASDGSKVQGETFLTGYTNTVYMSTEAIYIAYRKNVPWRSAQREKFFDVVVPVLPASLQSELESIRNSKLEEGEQWQRMSEALEEYVAKLDEDGQEDLYEDIQDALEKHERSQAEERSKSIVHKISLDLEHEARGEISGTLLNQFSLDEYEGNLRLATNVNVWTRGGSVRHNNVYVLDEDLDVIGEIEGIAEDERIYSTRFIGDRLYMVTFKQIDPFFVIDLSNPRKPEILGELKIPGWSDYLHPYDENHIIGIGKATEENQWGGISAAGVKLSLFNVEDVTNPIEVDTFTIGDRGSDSEVLRDHKALLFDKSRELLVLPVRETRGDYRNVWQGAYVFQVNEDGFKERETIAHYSGDRENYWSWWGSTSAVRRALFMDDTLYTISLEKVRMHDLDTLESIGTVKLPYESPDYGYPEPMPFDFVR